MTQKTGNKKFQAAFTLIEVMVAAAVLSVATAVIFPAHLMSLNVYQRYLNRLTIQGWADEKIWEAKEMLLSSDDFSQAGQNSGAVQVENRTYQWQQHVETLELPPTSKNILYTIALDVSWPEGRRSAHLARNSFLLKAKK